MADTSSTHLREQNENEKRGKIQRRRPKITLMDSVLRTPLKSTKRLQHNPVTPGTPPSIKSDKKRKFRSVSSSLNENVDYEAFARSSRFRIGGKTPYVRRTYSEPTVYLQPRSNGHDNPSPYRLVKRPRTTFDAKGGQLEHGMGNLHLGETEPGHMCGPTDCQQLMSRMKECLDLERKARLLAEEKHLEEMQKRLEMERLVDDLRQRLEG